MSTHIGVIAEDDSDVETLYELTCKIAREDSFKFRKFVGRGCSKMRRKCAPWARNLRERGCDHLVVVHDLDDRAESSLRAELEAMIPAVGFRSALILIPIREIEAWLMCDRPALKKVLGSSRLPDLPANPESIEDPKSELAQRIKVAGGGPYVHTIHNKKIAQECDVDSIEKRCDSFRPYVGFVRSAVGPAAVIRKRPAKRATNKVRRKR